MILVVLSLFLNYQKIIDIITLYLYIMNFYLMNIVVDIFEELINVLQNDS